MGGELGSAHCNSCLVLADEVAGEHSPRMSECVCVYVCMLRDKRRTRQESSRVSTYVLTWATCVVHVWVAGCTCLKRRPRRGAIGPSCVNDGWWGLLKVYLAGVMKCVCQGGEEYEGQALRLRQAARSPQSTLCRGERRTRRFRGNDSYSLRPPWRRFEGQADQVNSQPLMECQSPSTGRLACPLKSRCLPFWFISAVSHFLSFSHKPHTAHISEV